LLVETCYIPSPPSNPGKQKHRKRRKRSTTKKGKERDHKKRQVLRGGGEGRNKKEERYQEPAHGKRGFMGLGNEKKLPLSEGETGVGEKKSAKGDIGKVRIRANVEIDKTVRRGVGWRRVGVLR